MLHGSLDPVAIAVRPAFLGYTVGSIEHVGRSGRDLSVNIDLPSGIAFNIGQV